MSNIKNEIKLLLIHNEISLTELVNLLNVKYERTDSVQNLNNKLSKETIRYTEIQEIAEVLGYRLAWVSNKVKLDVGETDILYSLPPSRSKNKQQGKVTGITKIIRRVDPIDKDE